MRVVALIEAARLTDRELGQRIGVSQQSVNRWRRGEQVPGVERAASLADALGIGEEAMTTAIVDDLKSRIRGPQVADRDETELLEAACLIVRRSGATGLTLRAVAELCNVPITSIAYRWRTRDDLGKAALDYALASATEATVAEVVTAHLDSMARVGASNLWGLAGMANAVAVAGGYERLALLAGTALLGEPVRSLSR
jgi:transcriptional regulator with XRE-family HTH domain